MKKYVLGENAARFLRDQMANARGYTPAQPLRPREVKRDFAGGGGSGPPFHFRYSHSVETEEGETQPTHTVTIGEGAVQLGGFTVFSAGGTVSGMGAGTKWICVQVALTSGSGSSGSGASGSTPAGTTTFVAFSSTADINSAQLDVTKYIFPIYKVTDYAVVLDYRPMPNAGVWEDETIVDLGGSQEEEVEGSGET